MPSSRHFEKGSIGDSGIQLCDGAPDRQAVQRPESAVQIAAAPLKDIPIKTEINESEVPKVLPGAQEGILGQAGGAQETQEES